MQLDEQTLRQRWIDRGDWPTIQAADPRETVIPKRRAAVVTASEPSGDSRQPSAASADGVAGLGIELIEPIGEGGMGLVYRGRDRALHRFVAVKTLRPERVDEATTRELLQEARLTGMLEHPNIVPVYQLGADAQGVPIVVMKQIRGVSWRAYLNGDAPLDPKVSDTSDRLAWHLEVLLRVCHALEFAHDRQVLHRDIKPENVMIGFFGEVYLLDWGIAVSFDDALEGIVPLAREQTKIAGTFCYMAPEMASCESARLGVGSDVFLLGAVLHEILVGAPPHGGDNPCAVLIAAYQARVKEYDHSVPPELAAIARRAMAPLVEERFPDVHEFASRIRDFLRHQSSVRLTERGFEQLVQFDRLAEEHVSRETREAPQVLQEFAALRFAFRQALSEWSENSRAREGLDRALEKMVQRALERRDASAARLYLDEISAPSADCTRRVEELERESAEKDRTIQELRRELDTEIAVGQRMAGEIAIGTVWFLGAVALAVARRFTSFQPSTWYLYGLMMLVSAVSVAIYLTAPKSVIKPNALVYRGVLAGVFGGAVIVVLCFFLAYNGVAIDLAAALLLLAIGGIMLAIGIIVEPRLVAVGSAYVICGGVAAFWLEIALEILALSEAFALVLYVPVDRYLRQRSASAGR
ncbi:MAG: protein kinase [Myxococcales bacterium]|nr:protein kinase [Myxococcales bacterium]